MFRVIRLMNMPLQLPISPPINSIFLQNGGQLDIKHYQRLAINAWHAGGFRIKTECQYTSTIYYQDRFTQSMHCHSRIFRFCARTAIWVKATNTRIAGKGKALIGRFIPIRSIHRKSRARRWADVTKLRKRLSSMKRARLRPARKVKRG